MEPAARKYQLTEPDGNGNIMSPESQMIAGPNDDMFRSKYNGSAVSDPKALSALVITGEFPAISETFVLDQITGLIDRGLSIRIAAIVQREETGAHDEVMKYNLMEKADYSAISGPLGDRLAKAGKDFLHHVARHRWELLGELGLQGAMTLTGLRRFRSPFKALRFASILEQRPHDAILCHFGDIGAYTAWLRHRLGLKAPILTVFHGYEMSEIAKAEPRGPYRFLFDHGDHFLPVTDFWRRKLIAAGCPEDRVSVHRMGIHVNSYGKDLERSVGPFTFLSVGRLVEKKGHAFAIRAFAECVTRRPDIPCRLVLIGGGPMRQDLEQLARELDVKDLVEFVGPLPRDKVQNFLRRSDAFVLASITAENGDMEGLPVSILEAMASGLPVLSTYHSGIPEAVEDGVNGFLVPEKDVEGLSARMLLLLEDTGLAHRLGEAGRVRAEREFDIEFWNDRLVDIICETRARSGLVSSS
jgi:colanic acid/amylovoran biosynthesis glycosyltransferase